ncbi:unnamed protein product [Polarella glacialis]|uniref:Uncharacterized protein n=1 Tax=Polarella glacialis TaxID=89957 RepID=A0A813LB84_POLGL|nr:unnamed protein product [Polarella glacialis]
MSLPGTSSSDAPCRAGSCTGVQAASTAASSAPPRAPGGQMMPVFRSGRQWQRQRGTFCQLRAALRLPALLLLSAVMALGFAGADLAGGAFHGMAWLEPLVSLMGHRVGTSRRDVGLGRAASTSSATAIVEGLPGEGALPAPIFDYPPPAASLAWPRYLSWLAATVVGLQGLRRKLFGGAEAVALDPALPMSVRLELINSRRELRSRAQFAPPTFRKIMRDSADTLEEVPALLVTVAVLAGDALRKRGESLAPFRRLGEAEALLFTAGKLHLGMGADSGTMRLLGGDFLYAEGQWMLADLGSLPAIRLTSKMIRDVADGSSQGAAASEDTDSGSVSELGPERAMDVAFLRTGTYFAAVASGAAWISGQEPAIVDALRRYGTDLGNAIQIAQCREDAASQDCALWLARSAGEVLRRIEQDCSSRGGSSAAALRGMRRLAHRVERSCATSLEDIFRRQPQAKMIRGLTWAEMEVLRARLERLYVQPALDGEVGPATKTLGMGFRRDKVSDDGLEALIAAGLRSEPLSPSGPPTSWPSKEQGGPGAALKGSFRCVGQQLVEVNAMLDGAGLSEPATSQLVREEVLRLFASGGKRLRPALTLLTARALGAPDSAMKRVASLAASVEVLHSASLVHDDILDGADLRRGEPTVHTRLGERAATLVGDFLFATASVLVADLGSLPTVLLISKVVADFGRGELAQSAVRFEAVEYSMEDYLAKSFYKTASLLAAACQAAAVLSGASPDSAESESCYRFGAFVGLAFQVVDDVLDFTSTEEELGKPALSDLKEGNLGAPVLYGAAKGALDEKSRAELLVAINRRISVDGDLELVKRLVLESGGVEKSKALARRFVDLALLELETLPPSEARTGLRTFAEYVIIRSY